MNIYEKLQNMRVALQNMNVKKSGVNKFAGYNYYELADILPPIMKLELEHKVCSLVNFLQDKAILTLVNTEKPEETIVFESPMADASLKGAHAIQNLGAVETYQRRYLYMAAYEVVEADALDSTQGKEPPAPKQEPPKQKKSSNLSPENSAKLNEAIKVYASATGMTNKAVMAELTEVLRFDISKAKNSDVKRILETIEERLPF